MTESETTPEVFDLDALEQEGGARAAFLFTLDGDEYELLDPEGIDYRDLLAIFHAANAADYELAMKLLLPEGQREAFFDHSIPAWKLNKLFDRYMAHYGLSTPGKSRRSPRR